MIATQPASRTMNHNPALVDHVVQALQGRISRPVEDLKLLNWGEGLVLRGRVRSHYIKQMVQQVVMEATGRPIVKNDLEVLVRHRPRPLQEN